MENWICPECLDKYEIEPERHNGKDCKMGICPMCLEYRNLVKAKPLKESGKQEGNYAIARTLDQNRGH